MPTHHIQQTAALMTLSMLAQHWAWLTWRLSTCPVSQTTRCSAQHCMKSSASKCLTGSFAFFTISFDFHEHHHGAQNQSAATFSILDPLHTAFSRNCQMAHAWATDLAFCRWRLPPIPWLPYYRSKAVTAQGMTAEAFPDLQGFAEIAFCAVTAPEQVKGFGARLMNWTKVHSPPCPSHSCHESGFVMGSNSAVA